MHAASSRDHWRRVALVVGVLLIGLNLRPAITALSPLAERMRADGLSRETIGALTTIPLILFGLVGFWAGWIGQRIGFARALGLGLFLLAAGCFVRSTDGMFTGTALIGAGVALGNVLLPGLVKSRFPKHVGALTSLYVTAINLGAAGGIALAVPLANRLDGGWKASLAAWGVFALAILLIWSPQMIPPPAVRPPVHPLAGIHSLIRNKRAWQMTGYMGMQSCLFYSSVTWLPTLLQSRGMTEAVAAGWVTGLQVAGCVASLVVPLMAGKTASQSLWVVGSLVGSGLGVLGVLVLPLGVAGWAVILLGIGLNAGFGMALLLIAMLSKTPETAASLSSMAQAFGYLFAAPGPWIVGAISSGPGGWTLAFGLLVALATVAAVVGFFAGRPGQVSVES